jgi:LacI family transcriptional regulator
MSTASVRDVAVHAGVSVGTVSNVLNHPEKVLPDTVTKVQASIAALGFIRNDAARQLRAGHSRTIGLVVFQAGNPFFNDVARGAEDRAKGTGLSVILGNSEGDRERENAYLDLFEQQRVHGVLISPAGDVAERLESLRRRGIPAVLVDRSGDDSGVSSVSVDDVAGGRLAVEHLLAQGKRRIAYLGAQFEVRQISERFAGARQAVSAVADATLEIIEVAELDVIAGRHAGERIIERSPVERPDAIFAANDLLALGLIQALVMNHNIRVPEDIALIGYDDIDFASTAVVPLSSIRQPSRLIGERAVEVLLTQAADPTAAPQKVVFQPELVVRSSTVGTEETPKTAKSARQGSRARQESASVTAG